MAKLIVIIWNLIKIRPVRANLFNADRQTDRQTNRQTDRHGKANSHFLKIYERTKKPPVPKYGKKVKVKCTLVQEALTLCTGRTAHRGSRGIALPFHDHGTRRGWGVSVTPRTLFTLRERTVTHCTGGWVGPSAGLDRCGKSRPHRDSIPGPSHP
jgi:hypothetical protein